MMLKRLFRRWKAGEYAADKTVTEDELLVHVPIRQIIHGRLYDTSKAELLGSVRIPEAVRRRIPEEFRYCDPTGMCRLYRTESGNFFAEYHLQIAPVREWEAKRALGRDVSRYVEIFGEVEEA